MRLIIAPDSFKGSLSASQAAAAMAAGALQADPDAEVIKLPLADGGEGTVDALVSATGGTFVTQRVCGPLGEEVDATYGLSGDGQTAFVEMAAAAGSGLVPPEKRDPLLTTTYGVGELMLAAAGRGARTIVVGVGGSATNDGGAGTAQALGVRLLDSRGRDIPRGGGALERLETLDLSGLRFPKDRVKVLVACDVDNPLVGPAGASCVYGPQKGATPDMVEKLERALGGYAQVIHRNLGKDVSGIPGGGAAGGLAAGLAAFLDAEMKPGIELILDLAGFDALAGDADLVLTGEGRIDAQTLRGKTVMGVTRRASALGVTVVALAGCIGAGAEDLYASGLAAMLSVIDCPMTEADAMRNAPDLLRRTARAVAAVFRAGHVDSLSLQGRG